MKEAFLASLVRILLRCGVEFKVNSEIHSESSHTFKISFMQKKLKLLTIFAKNFKLSTKTARKQSPLGGVL